MGRSEQDEWVRLRRYYAAAESRIGYRLLLDDTRHFGFYRPGDSPWRLRAAQRRMEAVLADELAVPPGAQVLDAGCGAGRVAVRLAMERGWRVVGVDLLAANIAKAGMLAQRRIAGGPRPTFRQGDYGVLRCPGDSFDGVYTLETLVHNEAVEVALATFFRVLRPGGRLALVEYSHHPVTTAPARFGRVLSEINDWASMPGFSRFTHGALEALVEDAGFASVASRDLTWNVLPMLRVFAVIGALPYAVNIPLRRRRHVVNSMAGVEFLRYRGYWQYNLITATKPGP